MIPAFVSTHNILRCIKTKYWGPGADGGGTGSWYLMGTDFQSGKMNTWCGWIVTCVCVCVCVCVCAQSCLTLCDPMDFSPPGSCVHGDSPGKNTGAGCHCLLQGIFPTQGIQPGSPAPQADSLASEPPGKRKGQMSKLFRAVGTGL